VSLNLSALVRHRGDIFGGATAAIVALPLALAFGVSSGAGALAGLYGAILAGFFAATFGGTRTQVTGPTGPMTVVMALVVSHFAPNLTAAFMAVVLAGAIQIAFGKLGLGRFINLMPQPVVSGFMSGIGMIIIILQIGPLLGQPVPEGTVLHKLAGVPMMLAHADLQALLLGAISLGIMLLTPSAVARIMPAPLLAIVAGTLVAVLLTPAVPVIGAIPSGLPSLQLSWISLEEVPYVIRFALVLALLGAIDSLLTSLVADSITRTSHDSNRELVGQGLGNMASGILGGLPCAGATMRTMVNIRAGGSTRLSGALHSVILLAIVIGFSGAASRIPLAVLGGILVKVGIDIIDWRFLRRIRRATGAGVVIMLTTLLLTVLVDLMTAVAVGFVMASVLFVSRMAEAQIHSARFSFGAERISDLSPEEEAIMTAAGGRIVLFHVEGPLSFGSARAIAKLIQADIDKDVLAIDMSDIPFVDGSAVSVLEEVIQRLQEIGDAVLLFGARPPVVNLLEKAGVVQLLGEKHLLKTRIEALRLAREIMSSPAAETG